MDKDIDIKILASLLIFKDDLLADDMLQGIDQEVWHKIDDAIDGFVRCICTRYKIDLDEVETQASMARLLQMMNAEESEE